MRSFLPAVASDQRFQRIASAGQVEVAQALRRAVEAAHHVGRHGLGRDAEGGAHLVASGP